MSLSESRRSELISCRCFSLRCALVFAVLGACGGQSSPPNTSVYDARPAADASGERSEVFDAFGTIETIAGSGLITDKGVNGWQLSFEGGPGQEAELSRPHMAMGDEAGNVYIADKDANAIRKLSSDGLITTVAGTNLAGDDGDGPGLATQMRLSSPNGLWLGAQGSFYLLDLGNDKVRKVDASGQMSTLFTIGGASTGRGLWVADDESLAYVAAGSSLKQWTPEAGVTVLASGFASLGNLVVLSDGNLLVSDRLGHRVYQVSATGQKTVVAGNGQTNGGGDGRLATETGLNEVRGVWAHPEGGFFLATHKGGQIWYVDASGYIHLFVDGDTDSHSGDGLPFDDALVRISEPRAVTMDPAGNLIITEHDGGFIRRVNLK